MTASDRSRRRVTRLMAGVGFAVGGLLLARPQQVADRVAPAFPSSRLWLGRALAVRMLVQHGAVLAFPDRPVVRASSAVDLLHAATMVPFVASPTYGRAARLTGGVAAAYAAAALAITPATGGRCTNRRGVRGRG